MDYSVTLERGTDGTYLAGPEEWSTRKAARRPIWHELLHLPSIQDHAAEPTPSPDHLAA